MTPYATIADIEKRYPQETLVILTNDFNDGSADWDYAEILQPNLAAASSEIDSFLAKRYRVPLNVVPDIIKSFCVDIALSISSPSAAGHAKLIQERADYARKHLQKIADDEADLPNVDTSNGSGGDSELGASSPDIRTSKPKQVFTNDMMEKY